MGAWRRDARSLSFGEKLNLWDNSADNSVATFNLIFDQIQGGDQNDQIEILEPFTHLGRIILRHYSDGVTKELHYLFDVDYDNAYYKNDRFTVFDTYCRKTGRFLYTYKRTETIAQEYGLERGTVNAWLRGEQSPNSRVPIIVKARRRE